jgi:hypothetical protein
LPGLFQKPDQIEDKSKAISLVYFVTLTMLRESTITLGVLQMIESKASYPNYRITRHSKEQEDRLPAGPALLAVLGLSLVGWAFLLAPLVAIFH